MSLRAKALLLTATTTALLVVAVFLGARLLVIHGFEQREERAAVAHHARVQALVGTVVEEFGQRFEDWSSWDSVAEFAATPNQRWLDENVSFENFHDTLNVRFMAIVRADGTTVLGVWADETDHALVPLPPALREELRPGGVLMRGAAEGGAPIDGILVVDGVPLSVSSRPVRNTDKSPGKVAARFVVGRAMDAAWNARLEHFSFTHIELTLPDAPPADGEREELAARDAALRDRAIVEFSSGDTLHTLSALDDVHGRPALFAEVEAPREASRDAKDTLLRVTLGGALAGAALIGMFVWIVQRLFLQPLKPLLAGARAVERGRFEPIAVPSKDEIGEVGLAFNAAIDAVAKREKELQRANARTRLVLDGAGDGFVGIDRAGRLDGDPSAAMLAWFGPPSPGQTLGGYLFDPADEGLRTQLELGLLQIADDFLPFEVTVDQLPKRFTRDGRHFALELRQTDSAILVVIVRDVTLGVEREISDQRQRELHGVVRHVLRDPREFRRFIDEVESLFAQVLGARVDGDMARALHTLKGTLGVLGFAECARQCHSAEDALDVGSADEARRSVLEARTRWSGILRDIDPFLGRRDVIELSLDEHRDLVDRLGRLGVDGRTVQNVEALAYRPAAAPLWRMAEHAERIADRAHKPITVRVDHGGVRIPSGPLDPFCEALVHVVRNAVDHGLESPEDRVRAGKSPVGALELSARVEGLSDKRSLSFEIRDDGAGIDWGKVRARAIQLRLPFVDTQAGLIEVLFCDGFSTRDEVSEISGRGVGLAALRAACTAAGGVYGVRSVAGKGTSFVFRFPLPALGDVWAPTVPPPARQSKGPDAMDRLIH